MFPLSESICHDTVPIDVAIQCINYIFYMIHVTLQIITVVLLYLINVGEI